MALAPIGGTGVTLADDPLAQTGALVSGSKIEAPTKQELNSDFDTFLKLLSVQLQNQDPLNPMDGTEFTQQIATFSQLEQQIAGNKYLEDLSKARDYSAQNLAVSYINQEVLAPAGLEGAAVDVDMAADGAGIDFAYTLNRAAYSNIIQIHNADGDLVRTLDGANTAGTHQVEWDGKDEDGNDLDAGEYNIQVKAFDEEGRKIAHRLYTFEEVMAVSADESEIGLTLASSRVVDFSEVLQVRAPQNDNSN